MVSVYLPSDAFSQHLPSYLGFSYLGHGYLFTAAPAGTMAYIGCADSMCQEMRLGIQIGIIYDRFIISILCYFFIGVYLLFTALSLSAVQQSKSAMHMHISPLFWISFPLRLPQKTE